MRRNNRGVKVKPLSCQYLDTGWACILHNCTYILCLFAATLVEKQKKNAKQMDTYVPDMGGDGASAGHIELIIPVPQRKFRIPTNPRIKTSTYYRGLEDSTNSK